MGLVALLLYTQESSGVAIAVGLLLFAGDRVPGLLGPFTGARRRRPIRPQRVMISAALVQGVIVLVIAVTLPVLPLMLALVALRGCAAQVFDAASRTAVASLVDNRDLSRANAALGAGTYGRRVSPSLQPR